MCEIKLNTLIYSTYYLLLTTYFVLYSLSSCSEIPFHCVYQSQINFHTPHIAGFGHTSRP